MRKNASTRVDNSLTETVDHRTKLYSLAAAAAGVSLLALAHPAEGEVVVTHKNIPIPLGHPVSIDLNKDGISDFEFSLTATRRNAYLSVKGLMGGKAVGSRASLRNTPYASALIRGAKIGPSAHFSSHKGRAIIENTAATYFNTSLYYPRELYGKWGGNPTNRYLGVKFSIKGETHYGWVRLTVITTPPNVRISATITAYAYETVAGKKISAGTTTAAASDGSSRNEGETPLRPSLGALALGTDGVALWRREETLG